MQPDATQCDSMRSHSTVEVADLLGVHRQTVHRWVTTGRLAAFDIGTPGRPRLRVTDVALREFIAAGQISQLA